MAKGCHIPQDIVTARNKFHISAFSALMLLNVRSLAHSNLLVPRTRTITYGPRSFAVSGPCVWNDLPPTLRVSPGTLRQFQCALKTILFCSAYGTWFGTLLTVSAVTVARYIFTYLLNLWSLLYSHTQYCQWYSISPTPYNQSVRLTCQYLCSCFERKQGFYGAKFQKLGASGVGKNFLTKPQKAHAYIALCRMSH